MSTVLYIDDTEADVELLRTLLARHRIHVEGASTGAKGIAAWDPAKHDAVVIDWNLPDIPGMEVAKALREQHPKCHIAFISGALLDEHLHAATELGVELCLEKCMSMEHILRISAFVQDSLADKAGKEARP